MDGTTGTTAAAKETTMPMLKTFTTIKLSLVRTSSTYTEARPRHDALTPYETPASVHQALRHDKSLTIQQHDAIVSALVLENQNAPNAIWQSMLLAAFEPMLVRLRKKLGPLGNEDLDLDVQVAFLGAIRSVRAGSAYTLQAIRWATEAPLFAARRHQNHAPTMVEYDDDTHPQNPFGASADEKVAAGEVVRIIENRGGPELLEAMLATHGTDESLKDYVAREHAYLSDKERASIYGRLKVARQDVLNKLHAQLARAQTRAA